jgi:hypothetical protein
MDRVFGPKYFQIEGPSILILRLSGVQVMKMRDGYPKWLSVVLLAGGVIALAFSIYHWSADDGGDFKWLACEVIASPQLREVAPNEQVRVITTRLTNRGEFPLRIVGDASC